MRAFRLPSLMLLAALVACHAPATPEAKPSASSSARAVVASAAPASLLKPLPGTPARLTGQVLVDALYASSQGGASRLPGGVLGADGATANGASLVAGGRIVAQGAGNVIVPAGLINNGGSTLITNDGGSLITNDGGTLINNGGSTLINNGGSTLINNGGSTYALAQADGPQFGDAWPAAGMWLSVVDRRTGLTVPLGKDAAGKDVYTVYTDGQGKFDVTVDAATKPYANVVVRAPGRVDRRLVVGGAAEGQLDDTTQAVDAFVRFSLARQIMGAIGVDLGDGLVFDAEAAQTGAVAALALAQVKQAAEAANVKAYPPAKRLELGLIIADALLASADYRNLKIVVGPDQHPLTQGGRDANGRNLVEECGALLKLIRQATVDAAKGQADPVAYFGAKKYLVAANLRRKPTEQYQIRRAADMVDFLVREYLSVPVTGQFGKAHDVLHDLGLPLEVQERVDEVGVSLIVPILTAALKEGTDGTTAASRLGEVFMRADQLLGKGTLPAPVPEGTPLPLPTPPAAQAYEVSTVAGSASGAQGMADGPGASATFAQPRALALGPDHSLYVAEDFNSAIRRVRFDATGAATVETVVGGKPGMADGPAASARLNGPIALAFDHEGRLLVLDYYNKAIRRLTFDAAGKATVETIFPAPGAQAPEDFQDTSALAVAPDDSLVLASITTNTLSRLQEGPNGWTFTHLNMPQGASATRIEGPLAQAGFDKPHGVAFAPDGALWESEIDTGAVRRVAEPFSPTAATEVVAGSHARLPDGPLFWTSAWIQRPFGLAIDGEGRAVVSDAVSHRILRVRPDSWVEVLAGGGPFNGKGSDGTYVDGNGADARFNTPWGVAVDGDTIYVAEYAGNRIRRLRPLER